MDKYGHKELYAIDRKSGWLSDKSFENTLDEYIKWVEYEVNISPE